MLLPADTNVKKTRIDHLMDATAPRLAVVMQELFRGTQKWTRVEGESQKMGNSLTDPVVNVVRGMVAMMDPTLPFVELDTKPKLYLAATTGAEFTPLSDKRMANKKFVRAAVSLMLHVATQDRAASTIDSLTREEIGKRNCSTDTFDRDDAWMLGLSSYIQRHGHQWPSVHDPRMSCSIESGQARWRLIRREVITAGEDDGDGDERPRTHSLGRGLPSASSAASTADTSARGSAAKTAKTAMTTTATKRKAVKPRSTKRVVHSI